MLKSSSSRFLSLSLACALSCFFPPCIIITITTVVIIIIAAFVYLFCLFWRRIVLCKQDTAQGNSPGGDQVYLGQDIFQRVNELLQQNELIIAEIEKDQQPGTVPATGEILSKNATLLKQLNENLCNVVNLYQVLEYRSSYPNMNRAPLELECRSQRSRSF